MKLRSALLLLLALIILIITLLLLFLGYISIDIPIQEGAAEEPLNGNCHYLKILTDPLGVAIITGEGWYSCCADVTLDAPELINVSKGFRYIFGYWDVDATSQGIGVNPITVHMDADHTATAHYTAQYYLTMSTNYGTVTPGNGWYDAGSEVLIDAFSPSPAPGERYVWNGWTGTGDGNHTGADKSASVIMNSPINETASWTLQYYLTVSSPYGVPSGEGWYDAGAYASISTDELIDIAPNSARLKFSNWTTCDTSEITDPLSSSTTVLMDQPKTVTANYVAQYYLTVISLYDTPGGDGWYDNGTTAYATLNVDTVDHGNGTRRIFTSWSGDASGTDYAQSNPIFMNETKTATANWKTQHYLTLTTTIGGVTDPANSGWYDAGTVVSVTAIPETDYLFDHWELDGLDVGAANPYNVTMNTAHTLHAVFVVPPPPIYYLIVKTDPVDVTPISGEGWYNESESVVLAAPDYVDVSTGVRYRFTYWDVDGASLGAGVRSITVHMEANHTATAHYVLQYYLTVGTSPSGIVTIPGEGWYDESTSVPLTAPSITNYEFFYWKVDGAPQGDGVASISVSMYAPHTAIACYEEIVVGGFTVSIKSPLLYTWIGLNVVFITAVLLVGVWVKQQQKKVSLCTRAEI
jgi:hypothetical protein